MREVEKEKIERLLEHIRVAGSALDIAHRMIHENEMEVSDKVRELLGRAMVIIDKLEKEVTKDENHRE